MAELTLERIHSAPDLAGPQLQQLAIAPDARHASWLQGREDNREELELVLLDVESLTRTRLRAGDFRNAGALTPEEAARRERLRLFAGGITSYSWSPDGSALLLPIDGQLFVHDVGSGVNRALSPADAGVSYTSWAPDGVRVAAIMNRTLHVRHIADDAAWHQVAPDAGPTLSFGLAEFIAQEEMHRFDGYWWSPGGSRLAYTEVDESAVPVTRRFEIHADDVTAVDQHYPYAGGPNARVSLCVTDLEGSHWQCPVPDGNYLGRVAWLDDEHVLMTLQNRDQSALWIDSWNPQTGERRTLWREDSSSWINLNDDLKVLADGDILLTTESLSGASGFRQLVRLDPRTGAAQTLTPADFPVARVLAVADAPTGDEPHCWISSCADDPLEQHIYRGSLTAEGRPARVSEPGTWHEATVDAASGLCLVRESAPGRPPAVALRRLAADSAPVVAEIEPNRVEPGHPYHPYATNHPRELFGDLPADDGTPLFWRLTLPPGDGPHPCILGVYGGPGPRRVTRQWAPPWIQYFARRGFAVFELDNRGSGGRGHGFEAPIHGRLGDVEVRDQLAGIDWLASRADIDEQRIGVYGHSYGGYMTLMLLAKAPGRFAAGVSGAPVTAWELYDTHYTERYLGLPDSNPDGYRASNVFDWLDGLADPLLLMHGMADDNVLLTNSTRLMAELQKRAILFDIMMYPGSKHGLAGKTVSSHRFATIEAFFRRHLAND